jgi:hypothetical protein
LIEAGFALPASIFHLTHIIMKKKDLTFITLFLLLLFNSVAQKSTPFYPYKGFHVGITGQAEYIQKCSFVALTGIDRAPLGRWTYGWETGIEFSYHFAKYFGVSVGINYGTTASYERAFDVRNYPDPYGMRGKINRNHPSVSGFQEIAMLFPVKLEFHYSLHKDLFFMVEMGVKVKGIFQRLVYGIDAIGTYSTGLYLPETPDDYDPETGFYSTKPYYFDYGWHDMGKISCNLLLGLGLSYKLPHGDLLRFTTGVNLSFNNIVEGYYRYFLTDSYGTFAVKNDFIYTQLSYIHTFNWEKAKKYVKKQEYSFSSKKERRGKILELLNAW